MSAAAMRALAGHEDIIDTIWFALMRPIGCCADAGMAKMVARAMVAVAIL
jgi:hypothetical protein